MTPNKFKNAKKKSHLAQKSYGSTFCDMSHHTIASDGQSCRAAGHVADWPWLVR